MPETINVDKRIYRFFAILIICTFACTSFFAYAKNEPGEGNVIDYYKTRSGSRSQSAAQAASSLTKEREGSYDPELELSIVRDKAVDLLKKEILQNLSFVFDVRQEYDDNIFREHSDPDDDWITYLEPRLKFDFKPSIKGLRRGKISKLVPTSLSLELKGRWRYYLKHPELNRNDSNNFFMPGLAGEVEFSDRLRFFYDVSRRQTERSVIQPGATGEDSAEQINFWDIMYGGTLEVGPKANIWEFGYKHQRTIYDEDAELSGGDDIAKNTFSVTSYFGESPDRQPFIEYEMFRVKYPGGGSKRSNYEEHELYLGWRGKLSGKLSLEAKAGGALDRYEGEDLADNKGVVVGEINLNYDMFKRLSFHGGYSRDVDLLTAPTDTSEGITVDINRAQRTQDRYTIGLNYIPAILDKRLSFSLEGIYNSQDYAQSSGTDNFGSIDEYKVLARPRLSLKNGVSLEGRYEYTRRLSTEGTFGYIQNKFLITLKLEF
ncbi:MAG: outer membrane beta-barrel protein [Candidatus Omnitrophica bacterium]|nr:outer membrane beta-barrel protein [Candidatus Omnitrophota bacterium]